MFVRFYLKSNSHMYAYDKVNLLDFVYHKFPSGKNRKCMNLLLDDGKSINFCFSEVCDLVVEDYPDQRHPFYDVEDYPDQRHPFDDVEDYPDQRHSFDGEAQVIFVEDGQVYEKRF